MKNNQSIIIEKKRNDELIIAEVRKSSALVGIYGCGNIGVMLLEYLHANDIKVSFFVVDDEWYSIKEFCGLPIKKMSNIVNKEVVNIFIGMADIKKAQEKLQHFNKKSRVYCIANPCLYLKEYDIDVKYYLNNKERFEKSYALFEDELSKEIFNAYLNTRINNNYKYLMPFGGCTTYFNDEFFSLSENEIYVDCGAYNGDTIKKFLQYVNGNYKKIYAIEPDNKNCKRIKDFIKKENLENIEVISKGLWNEQKKIGFICNAEQESSINENNDKEYIEVDSLDNILGDNDITYIKLSIQGAEEKALLGAKNILKNIEPMLAMAIFVNPDALIRLPQIIKEINPKYKLYLRCEESFFARVILYAKVEE